MRNRAIFLIGAALLLPASGTHATPLQCANPCTIATTSSLGYRPPLIEVASGTRITWVTTEASHPTSDSIDDNLSCFLVSVGASTAPVPVAFTIESDGLYATTAPGTLGEVRSRCGTARALPSAGYALAFRCRLHTPMQGELIIDP